MSELVVKMTKVGDDPEVKAPVVNDFRVNARCIDAGLDVRCKIYVIDTEPVVVTYSVTTDLENVTSNAPATVNEGSTLVVVLAGTGSNKVQANSVEVTMGDTDITSTAYDHSTKTITIAGVTGNVSITAVGRPYDAEVEYLQGDGAAYIDTGFVMNARNYTIEMGIKWAGNDASLFETFIGFMAASTTPRSGFHKYVGHWMFGCNASKDTGIAVDSQYHTIKLESVASTNKESLYIDGSKIGDVQTSSTGIGNNTLSYYIFARHRNGTFDNPSKVQIHYLKYTYYNALVLDYIPVRDNGVGYLYDKVSGQLFGNANSSGAFTYGNDV